MPAKRRSARRGSRRPAPEARRPFLVAIDGPAGAGKTTVARAVAEALGIPYLETGSMYRALTWVAMRRGVAPSDAAALARLAREIRMERGPDGLLIDGRPAGPEIRSTEVSANVSEVSAHPGVRRELIRRQREMIGAGPAVVEGRDIGTVVCPDAPVKVFLTASPEARARRRHRELARAGADVRLADLRRTIEARDAYDSARPTSPLVPAVDAHIVDSTGASPGRIVARILRLVRDAGGS